MYRKRKAPHGSRGSWPQSGRYGSAGKRAQRVAEREFARDVGRSIQRMAGGGAP